MDVNLNSDVQKVTTIAYLVSFLSMSLFSVSLLFVVYNEELLSLYCHYPLLLDAAYNILKS